MSSVKPQGDLLMRRLIPMLTGTVIGLGMTVGVAAADTQPCGSILESGPGSTNYNYCYSHSSDTINCTNKIDLNNNNNQQASSGASSASGNTVGGSAVSGGASNDNSTSINLNTGCEAQKAATPAASASTSTSAPASTPAATPAGGRGGGMLPAPGASSATPQVVSLPETGSNTAVTATEIGGALAAALMLATRFSSGFIRKFSLNR